MHAASAPASNSRRSGERRPRLLAVGVALLVVVASACTADDDEPTAAAAVAESEPTASSVPPTQPPPTAAATAPPSTVQSERSVPSTTPVATSPPTTESCGAFCPLTDEQQSATDVFFAAYNGDDWDAFVDVLATDQPAWVMTVDLTQNTELMRADFNWSASMSETWTPERCVDQYGTVSCSVIMEDDLHRLLAAHGMEPSTCQISFEVVDGKPLPKRYDALTGCHATYDGAMHFYGAWYEEQYPDETTIQAPHYRAWNQADETAGARAAAHLAEWGEVVDAFFADGGDIFDITGHP